MYCTNCGKQIEDGAYSCPHCGTVFDSAVNDKAQQPQQPQYAPPQQQYAPPQQQYAPPQQQYAPPQYAPMPQPATGSMNVLSIVAFAVSFFFGLVGFILGCVALGKHKRDPLLRGKGFATAAVVIGIISTVAVSVYYLIIILIYAMGVGSMYL